MMKQSHDFCLGLCCKILLPLSLVMTAFFSRAAEAVTSSNVVTGQAGAKPLTAVLPASKGQQVQDAVDRALSWMATQQATDGSFPTLAAGQPAVTSLCVLAFLSRGHQPEVGPHGQRLSRAIDYVMACQKSNGLIALQPNEPKDPQETAQYASVYNHAISGVMLAE